MTAELNIYKQNRINTRNKIYNNNISSLNQSLNNNIKTTTNNSKLSHNQKQILVRFFVNEYNKKVNNLKNILNRDISAIQKITPAPIVINKNKKALLIGINYIGTQNELSGCINDVNSIKERISKNGFINSNINILTDNTSIKPTKDNILNAFTTLLANSVAGDLLFMLFSGHGSYTKDLNGDELTGYDQMVIPSDLSPIVDDELKSIIKTNLKKNVVLFAMFDSCFSGSVLDLKYQYMDSLNYDSYTENDNELETNGNVFMISGCNDYQTSADMPSNGAMTWSLLECLKQTQSCSWRELVKNMRNLLKTSDFEQIPQLSTGIFENIDTQIFI